jgi:putative FmdB family regulatory protein
MPLYDYRCPACGAVSEELIQSISAVDATVVECDVCKIPKSRLLNTGTKYTFKPGHFFEPYLDDRMGKEPVLIKSPDHFRQVCREKNLDVTGAAPDKLR